MDKERNTVNNMVILEGVSVSYVILKILLSVTVSSDTVLEVGGWVGGGNNAFLRSWLLVIMGVKLGTLVEEPKG